MKIKKPWSRLIPLAEESLDHRIESAERGLLIACCKEFLRSQGYSRQTMKEDLQRLEQIIRPLTERFGEMQPYVKISLNATDDSIVDGLFDELMKTLPAWKELRRRVRRELEKLGPERTGPKSDWAFNSFVSNLCWIFFKVTGKKPGGRPPREYSKGLNPRSPKKNTFTFIRTCLDFLHTNFGTPYYADGSIDKAFKKDKELLGFLYHK